MFRAGYIIDRRQDAFWFIGLPFLAIVAALASQRWLSVVALASCGLWITLPHHFAGWLRTYAIPDELRYYRGRLIAGPLVIAAGTLLGLWIAPITLLLLVTMWDHQHSLMQQHGFSRIYDFKAKTGAPSTPRFDLTLMWVLYVNLFLTSPFFTEFWVRELYRYQLSISADAVRMVHTLSWGITLAYLVVYAGHLVWCVVNGHRLNHWKYGFIASSFFLWYYVSWQVDSLLVYGIAHKIMHGVQYIVFVVFYLRHKFNQEEQAPKSDSSSRSPHWLQVLLQPRHVLAFVALSALYALFFQLIARQPLSEFGFGLNNFSEVYGTPIPEHGMQTMSEEASYHMYAGTIIYTTQLLHYYIDSFIWKVRDKKVQSAL